MRSFHAALAAALISGFVPASHAAEVVVPSSTAISQTVVTLAAGSDAIVGSNKSRHYLCLMNIGTGLVTLGFDRLAVAGSGWALEGAATDGRQGGSMCWESVVVAASTVHAISGTGSTIVVLEGK
jgi:hypothetical protein